MPFGLLDWWKKPISGFIFTSKSQMMNWSLPSLILMEWSVEWVTPRALESKFVKQRHWTRLPLIWKCDSICTWFQAMTVWIFENPYVVYWDFYMVCMDPFCFDCEQAYFNQTNLTARFWQIAKAKKPIMHMVSLLVSRTNSIDFMEDNFYLIRQHTSACLTTSDLRQVCGNDRNLISVNSYQELFSILFSSF